MRTNYFKFDLYPTTGAALHNTMSASFDQVIQNNTQTAYLNGSYYTIAKLGAAASNVFIFMKTNHTDVIKKIDRSNHSYQDITTLLQVNEEIAFASYVLLENNCIGFSSTIYGPKIGAFATYYDHHFYNANSSNNLRFEAITKTITPAQALQFSHMGKVNVLLENNSPFATRQLTNFLGVTNVQFDDVESFEIIIKPKRSKNIRSTLVPILSNMPNGVREMTIAAKNAIGDQAVELHIAASGGIYDIINPRGNGSIHSQMTDNFSQNGDLRAAGY